jgi:hypothetical protein
VIEGIIKWLFEQDVVMAITLIIVMLNLFKVIFGYSRAHREDTREKVLKNYEENKDKEYDADNWDDYWDTQDKIEADRKLGVKVRFEQTKKKLALSKKKERNW